MYYAWVDCHWYVLCTGNSRRTLSVNKMSSTCRKMSRLGLKINFFLLFFSLLLFFFSFIFTNTQTPKPNTWLKIYVMCHNFIHFILYGRNFCAQINLYWTCQVLFDVVLGWWNHYHTHNFPCLLNAYDVLFIIFYFYVIIQFYILCCAIYTHVWVTSSFRTSFES